MKLVRDHLACRRSGIVYPCRVDFEMGFVPSNAWDWINEYEKKGNRVKFGGKGGSIWFDDIDSATLFYMTFG